MIRFFRTFLAVVRREFHEWRLAWVGAALLGAFAFATPWLPLLHHRPVDVRAPAAFAILALLSGVLTLLLGSRLANRDLAEERLGFYFNRPISPAALWFGRLAGALVVLLVAGLLVLGPSLIAHPDFLDIHIPERAFPLTGASEAAWSGFFDYALLPQSWGLPGFLAQLLVGAALGLTLVHAVVTSARSRNAWLLVDLLALGSVVALVWSAVDQLLTEQAIGPLVWAERAFGGWTTGALVVAGAVQISVGRTDFERGRRWLSSILWGLLAVGALGVFGFAKWALGGDVDSLRQRSAAQVIGTPHTSELSPNKSAEWLFLGGPSRFQTGYRAAFLLDTKSRQSFRLGPLDLTRHSLKVASEGFLAWARCSRLAQQRPCELWSLNLRDADPRPQPTGVPVAPFFEDIVLSLDGELVALPRKKRWSIYETSSGRLVWTTNDLFETVVFQPGQRLLLFQATDGRVDILELDLSRRSEVSVAELQPLVTGVLEDARANFQIFPFPQGGKLLTRNFRSSTLSLHQARSGKTLTEPIACRVWSNLRFLSDERVAFIQWKGRLSPDSGPRDDRETTVVVLEAEGGPRRFSLPQPRALLGDETTAGKLLISLYLPAPPPGVEAVEAVEAGFQDWTLHELDLENGQLTPRLQGAKPMMATWRQSNKAVEESLLDAGGGAVVGWNSRTGELRSILPPTQIRQ